MRKREKIDITLRQFKFVLADMLGFKFLGRKGFLFLRIPNISDFTGYRSKNNGERPGY